jgi:hypothetical protein
MFDRQFQECESFEKSYCRHDAKHSSNLPYQRADGKEGAAERREHEKRELGQIFTKIQASKAKPQEEGSEIKERVHTIPTRATASN